MSTVEQPLTNEVAIVTGASSGIGAATARELARRGARVVLAARRTEALDAQVYAIKEAGGNSLAVTTDVADPRQVTSLVDRAVEAYGRVDILVNNAGIGGGGPFAETPPREIARMIDVNLLGAALLTRAVLPGMLQRRHGAIISVGSVAGHIAVYPLYSGTKFGLRGFSLALRRETAGSGVSVSLVSPGLIRTSISNGWRWVPMAGPELVATTIADLVVHPRREAIVPGYYRAVVLADRALPWLGDLAVRWRRGLPL